jgi:hypothetical protein
MIQLNVENALTNVSVAAQQIAQLVPKIIMLTQTILVLCVQVQQQQAIMDAANV